MQPNLVRISTDKAYILGLIIGGGEITGNTLTITLPYRNWGDIKINPERGGEISEYIIRAVKPVWFAEYDMDISYSVQRGRWQLSADVSTLLLADLEKLDLPLAGNFREQANLSTLTNAFSQNVEKIKRFISGLTDTIGSLNPNHRHRNANFQIISFEFAGFNYNLVGKVAQLFELIGCVPDQVLWNHPNFHATKDRYYTSWKKGFKLRIRLYDYMLNGSFVSEAKKLSATENLTQNTRQEQTEIMRIAGRTTLHVDENSNVLPVAIKGNHFIHYLHVFTALGIPVDSRSYDFLKQELARAEKYVAPFTVLTKGTREEIEQIIKKESYLSESAYSEDVGFASNIESVRASETSKYLYGTEEAGFPLTTVLQAIAYVGLAELGGDGLMGKRVLGSYESAYERVKSKVGELNVKVFVPNKGTCLLVQGPSFSALVGYIDNEFNKGLISYDTQTLSLKVKEPQFSECIELDAV